MPAPIERTRSRPACLRGGCCAPATLPCSFAWKRDGSTFRHPLAKKCRQRDTYPSTTLSVAQTFEYCLHTGLWSYSRVVLQKNFTELHCAKVRFLVPFRQPL